MIIYLKFNQKLLHTLFTGCLADVYAMHILGLHNMLFVRHYCNWFWHHNTDKTEVCNMNMNTLRVLSHLTLFSLLELCQHRVNLHKQLIFSWFSASHAKEKAKQPPHHQSYTNCLIFMKKVWKRSNRTQVFILHSKCSGYE